MREGAKPQHSSSDMNVPAYGGSDRIPEPRVPDTALEVGCLKLDERTETKQIPYFLTDRVPEPENTYDSQQALLSTTALLLHWTKHSQDPPKTVKGYRPSGKSTHHSGLTSSNKHLVGDQAVSSKPSINATINVNRSSA